MLLFFCFSLIYGGIVTVSCMQSHLRAQFRWTFEPVWPVAQSASSENSHVLCSVTDVYKTSMLWNGAQGLGLGWLLWTCYWTFSCNERLGISWRAGCLSVSQEGLLHGVIALSVYYLLQFVQPWLLLTGELSDIVGPVDKDVEAVQILQCYESNFSSNSNNLWRHEFNVQLHIDIVCKQSENWIQKHVRNRFSYVMCSLPISCAVCVHFYNTVSPCMMKNSSCQN